LLKEVVVEAGQRIEIDGAVKLDLSNPGLAFTPGAGGIMFGVHGNSGQEVVRQELHMVGENIT
jgi:hypothetical protein